MSTQQKIIVSYAGEDSWNRIVFMGDNGRYYKTTELNPACGFPNLPQEEQHKLFRDLHTTDDFDGEPGFPVNLEHFELV